MGHRPAHVPHFGNWEANNNVRFTTIFDNPRADKGGGKKFNPNDPAENPVAFGLKPNYVSGLGDFDDAWRAPSKLQPDMEAGLPSQQGGDGHGYSKMSRADPSKGVPSAKENLSAVNGSRKGTSALGASTRNNESAEDSPNHQMYEGRLGNRTGSPYQNLFDGGNAYSASIPGKSRLRGTSRADETPDRSAALPKFGAWDENDPSAGEGYTTIFNQHRDEKKQGGPGRIPTLQNDPSKLNDGNRYKKVQGSQQHKKSSVRVHASIFSSVSQFLSDLSNRVFLVLSAVLELLSGVIRVRLVMNLEVQDSQQHKKSSFWNCFRGSSTSD